MFAGMESPVFGTTPLAALVNHISSDVNSSQVAL